MTDRELLNMALHALEQVNKLSIGKNAICLPAEIDTVMDALRQALAQQDALDKLIQNSQELGAYDVPEPVEPPDYVEPITFDYHDGWEAGFKAGVEARGQK